jgi:hypothetical protein
LARHGYNTDAASLLNAHPEIWGMATSQHAINAGPAQAGRAMGDPAQLAQIDLYMADPQVASLMQAYGGTPEPARSSVALEQVRLYGQARYEQMTRMANAMQSVREQYVAALHQAQDSGAGIGWGVKLLPVKDADGGTVMDAAGQPELQNRAAFDIDTFTAWYTQQSGVPNQAFASLYGNSHSTTIDVSHRTANTPAVPQLQTITRFDNPAWLFGQGGMVHSELVGLDLNNKPSLNDDALIGFDLQAGWVTHSSNLHQKQDIGFTIAMVAMVAMVSCATYGAASSWATGAGYGAMAGAVGGAAAGAASSFVSGALNDNLTFKAVLQGALAGALAGAAGDYLKLGTIVDPALVAPGTVGGFVSNFSINTAVQALMQGKITDQMLLANLASAAGATLAANLESGIAKAFKAGDMTAGEAFAARGFAKVLTSAVKALGNPDDPNHGFASAFINDLMPATGPTQANGDPGTEQRNALDMQSDEAHAARAAQQSDEILTRRGNELLSNGAAGHGPVNTAGNTPNASSNTYVPPQAPADLMGPGLVAQGEPGAGPPPNGVQQIIVTGRALPRDADGNRLYIDPQGNGVVMLNGGGIVSLGGLSPELARDLASTATLGGSVLMRINTGVAFGAGAGTGATALGEVLTAGRALVGGAVDAAGRVVSSAGLGLAESLIGTSAGTLATGGLLLVIPSQIGQETRTYLGANTRFVQQSDMIYGQVQERNAQGDWEVLRADVRKYEVMGRTVVLSDDELARLNRPSTTPITPPQPSGPPPLPAWVDRNEPLPGYTASPAAGPTTLVTPTPPATNFNDLVIENSASNSAATGGASPSISADDLTDKSRAELEQIAKDKGLVQDPKNPNKWRDPVTGVERMRIDRGHVDPTTGMPYNNPRAAVEHVHGYDPAGSKIRDPSAGNDPHFPIKP